MKYLLSSKIYPNVNGIYEKRYGNNYLYHNTSNKVINYIMIMINLYGKLVYWEKHHYILVK